MKLLTEEQRTKLLANGTRRGADHKPVVKWFNAGGTGTWLLSELDPEYPDECGFGLADLGFGTPELGSIGLLELRRRCRPNRQRGPVCDRRRSWPAGGEVGAQEGVQAVGGEVLDPRQADPAGPTLAATNNEPHALWCALASNHAVL